jgi:regulator of protease activity HflC (stomatin/prohibitin superfamily)
MGVGEGRLLGPGPHWIFPYPINELVKIPVAKKSDVSTDSFWYFQKDVEKLPEGPKKSSYVGPALDPLKDGYCITRSEGGGNSADSDYNIVHSKWKLIYQIDDPERFFRNIYVDNVRPGESYFDVAAKNIKPLLNNAIESSVVSAMVNYTIDEAIISQDRIPAQVRKSVQEKLNQMESGITVVSIQLTDIIWPRQVDAAFLASIRASQESQKAVSEARGYAENTLNEAGGPVAAELLTALNDKNADEAGKELLWNELAGTAQEKIAQARAYRTEVVETAKANAEYLEKILPEYRKRPKLVTQKIYQDAIEIVFNNADEKIIIQPTEGTKGKEIRLLLNRDPKIKPKTSGSTK